MDDMREIVTVEQVNHWFILLAILLPIAGAGVGALVGRGRGNVSRGAVFGLIVGLLGPVNLALWYVYNAITDRLGLDTVKNLLVQLALFVLMGAVAGFLIGRFWRSPWPETGTGQGFIDPSGPSDSRGGSSPVLAGGGSPRANAGVARTFEEAEEPPRES